MTQAWEALIKGMYQAMGQGFKQRIKEKPSLPLASWTFLFASDQKAKLNLYLYDGQYIVFYEQRGLGIVLDQHVIRQYFPGGRSS